MVDVFRALADETRRLILDELASSDGKTLFGICSLLLARHDVGSSRQAISQHLAVLEEAGLITTERRGSVQVTRSLVGDGIPLAQFSVDDVEAEHGRLTDHGVTFTQPPTALDGEVTAVFDDSCGNLVMIISEAGKNNGEPRRCGSPLGSSAHPGQSLSDNAGHG